jgi:hypothetical protein
MPPFRKVAPAQVVAQIVAALGGFDAWIARLVGDMAVANCLRARTRKRRDNSPHVALPRLEPDQVRNNANSCSRLCRRERRM